MRRTIRRTSRPCSSNALVDELASGSSNIHCTLRGVFAPDLRVPPGGRLSVAEGGVESDAFTFVGESMGWSCTVTVDGVGGVGPGERRMLAMDGTWLGGGISASLERAGVRKTLARPRLDSPRRNRTG